MKIARKRAIESYTLIVNGYPTHAQVDEVLYYLAYEYEQAGDLKNARTVYYDLKKCLDLSSRFQYFDGFSRSCVWLAKNYKAEYHVVDELRGAPTMANIGLDEKAFPILLGSSTRSRRL